MVVAVVLLAIVFGAVLSALQSTQKTVVDVTVQQDLNARTRRAAEKIAEELRDLNVDSQDLKQADSVGTLTDVLPAGFPDQTFGANLRLCFRRVTDLVVNDPPQVELNPPRAGGAPTVNDYRQLYLDGGEVVLDIPAAGRVPLVDRVSDVRLELVRPARPDGEYVLRITVKATGFTYDGDDVVGQHTISIQLRNAVADAV